MLPSGKTHSLDLAEEMAKQRHIQGRGLRVQVVVVGQNYKPLAQDPSAAAGNLAGATPGLGASAGPINVPKCRKLAKAKWRKSELQPQLHAMHYSLP